MRYRRIAGVVLVTAGAAFGVTALGRAAGPDDDLAVVKKAVASPAAARASQAATPEPERPRAGAPPAAPSARPGREERPLVRTGREPQWFKVRIVEKGTGRKRVTVNLPLSLVRALGDDTIDWDCRGSVGCRTIRLSEILQSLEAGQDLVEIDDDDATVKVWVE